MKVLKYRTIIHYEDKIKKLTEDMVNTPSSDSDGISISSKNVRKQRDEISKTKISEKLYDMFHNWCYKMKKIIKIIKDT